LSDELPSDLRPVVDFFGLPGPEPVAKDFAVLRAFVAEALNRAPEVSAIACVNVTETAAEKLVSLARRTAMDLAGLSRDFDPALVRHMYDLHIMRGHVDRGAVIALARVIAVADANDYRNQYSAYHADIAGETRKALDNLRADPIHASAMPTSSPPWSTANRWISTTRWEQSLTWWTPHGRLRTGSELAERRPDSRRDGRRA
jgi:hypothetical protein